MPRLNLAGKFLSNTYCDSDPLVKLLLSDCYALQDIPMAPADHCSYFCASIPKISDAELSDGKILAKWKI
jgi:hypothetical protein